MNGLLTEQEHLSALVSRVTDRGACYRRLADSIRGLSLADAEAAEIELDRAARRLRSQLLADAAAASRGSLRSPAAGTRLTLPSGEEVEYGYERNLPAELLERRLDEFCRPGPVGWNHAGSVYSSGMAAIGCALEWVTYEFARRHNRRPAVRALASYFETTMTLELLRPRSAGISAAHGSDDLLADRPDILVIEPVQYNWDLSVLDVGEFLAQWRDAAHRPSVVVIDSTLSATHWPIGQLLDGLARVDPPLVIDVRSGLKLDQQGLELANLGIAVCYGCGEDDSGWWTETVANLPTVRGIRGASLGAEALAALCNGFIFDRAMNERYTQSVFSANTRIAEAVSSTEGGLFETIAYPGLVSSAPHAVAPFTVMKLRDAALADYEKLLGVVRWEAARRGIPLANGSSFGFRGHRYEVIVPRLSERAGLLKFAMGARHGPALDRISELLIEIAGHPSIRSINEAYRGIAPARLDLPRPARTERTL